MRLEGMRCGIPSKSNTNRNLIRRLHFQWQAHKIERNSSALVLCKKKFILMENHTRPNRILRITAMSKCAKVISGRVARKERKSIRNGFRCTWLHTFTWHFRQKLEFKLGTLLFASSFPC